MQIEVMIVDADLGARGRVAEAFRDAGCHVVEASTSIEARDRLQTTPEQTAVIVVADTLPAEAGAALRAYLDRAYPRALVIGIGGAEWLPGRTRIDPTEDAGQLASQIRAVLAEMATANERALAH